MATIASTVATFAFGWCCWSESFYQARQITKLKEYRNITEHSVDDGTFLIITVYYSDPSVGARESGKGLSQCNIFVLSLEGAKVFRFSVTRWF